MEPLLTIVFSLVVLLFSVALHEVSHGLVAYSLGDLTAKDQNRLTLNPLKHLDPLGSVILPLLLLLITFGRGPIFGWAKPVPVNPYNFRDQRWGSLKVALAGPVANLLIALIFGLMLRFLPLAQPLFYFFSIIVLYNLLLAIFNLIPVPPLDGSHILFSVIGERFFELKLVLQQYGFFILLLIIFFGIRFVFFIVSLLYRFLVGVSALT